jgi:peptidoglycan hydrolase-like protein with peptidoglycan-binding domain
MVAEGPISTVHFVNHLATPRARRLLRALCLLVVATVSVFSPLETETASAHGGGLDGNGGHNCYVPSCAGTYHCHRPWGGRCLTALNPSPITSLAPLPALPVPQTRSSTAITAPRITTTTLPRPAECVSRSGGINTAETVLLQQTLRERGAYRSAVDGAFGADTKNAVVMVARGYRMLVPDPALPTDELLSALKVACNPVVEPAIRISVRRAPDQAAVCFGTSDEPTDDEVVLLQYALSNRTYDVGPIDGKLGPKTLGALSGFESANQLPTSDFDRIHEASLRRLGISCSLPTELTPSTTSTTEAPRLQASARPSPVVFDTARVSKEPGSDTKDGQLPTLVGGVALGALLGVFATWRFLRGRHGK